MYNTIGNIACIPSGQALCPCAAHETEDLHSVSPGLGEHAPNFVYVSASPSQFPHPTVENVPIMAIANIVNAMYCAAYYLLGKLSVFTLHM